MDKIIIIDNFLSDENIKKVTDYYDNIEWQCKCSNRPNANLESDIPFWRHELSDIPLFSNELKLVIENYFNKKYDVKRVYSVAQTNEQNSNYHFDDKEPNSFTLCLYINKNIIETDKGYFYIKIPNEKHIVAVNPLYV